MYTGVDINGTFRTQPRITGKLQPSREVLLAEQPPDPAKIQLGADGRLWSATSRIITPDSPITSSRPRILKGAKMAIFAITFRIHNDAGYSERYESVVVAIKTIANGAYWDEPTSFFLLENSDLNSEGLANKIDQLSSFSPSKDLLLVTNLSQKGYKAIGSVKDNDLHVLMKKR